jgi:hypothetical protein
MNLVVQSFCLSTPCISALSFYIIQHFIGFPCLNSYMVETIPKW